MIKNSKIRLFFLVCFIFIFLFSSSISFAAPKKRTDDKKLKEKVNNMQRKRINAPKKKSEKDNISFDFDNVDIRVFIKFISELMGKNFIVDEKVRGKITVISPKSISKKEAFTVFETILEVHGFSMVKAGKLIKIMPSVEVNRMNIRTNFNRKKLIGRVKDEIVTQIIPLKYANVGEIKNLLTPLVSRGGMILAYNKTNTIFITDVYSNITRLLRILRKIDVEGAGKELTIFSLKHATATKIVKIIGAVFKDKGSKKSGRDAFFIADDRANTVIAIATKEEMPRIEKVMEKLDKTPADGNSKVNIYYLKNATAANVAKVLQSLTKKGSKNSGSGVISSKSRITTDTSTNSLVITSEKEDYSIIKKIIEKLDVPRDMVYIESLIVEVEVSDSFDFGVSMMGGNQNSDGVSHGISSLQGKSSSTLGNVIGTPDAVANPSGFSMGIFDKSIKIGDLSFSNLATFITAVRTKTGYNILSTPQILTLNNEAANISVGDNIPYSTSSASVVDGSNSYDYKDVGVKLSVTPQISKDRKIRLKINQEVKSVSSANISENNIVLPTTKTKTIDTTVIVRDGATVVIGGLISKEKKVSKSSVPCLGDIPLIGWLFRSSNEYTVKKNLYIFLSPRIIRSGKDAEALYKEKLASSNKMSKETISLFADDSKDKDTKSIQVKYAGKGKGKTVSEGSMTTPKKMPLKMQKYSSDSIDSFIESIGRSEYGLGEEIP